MGDATYSPSANLRDNFDGGNIAEVRSLPVREGATSVINATSPLNSRQRRLLRRKQAREAAAFAAQHNELALEDVSNALLDAARDCKTEVVLLGAAGADIEARENRGSTPLQNASVWGHTEITSMMLPDYADINCRDNENKTALMNAAIIGHAEAVSLLLAAGADIEAKDNRGSTALLNAADNGHEDVVSMIICFCTEKTHSFD